VVDFSSKIYVGTLFHKRFSPKVHAFAYPSYVLAINLDDLESLNQNCFGFGYNRFSFFSIWSKDYLGLGDINLKKKFKDFVKTHCSEKLESSIQTIMCVTTPRFLNYVFNPASFFYGYDQNQQLKIVLAEVHNTFGEAHIYLLEDPIHTPGKSSVFKIDKNFHVSPFFDRSGYYEFKFSELSEYFKIQIELKDENSLRLIAILDGKSQKLTSQSLWRTYAKLPFSIVLTMPRILMQAMILFYLRKLPVYKKPPPDHPMTIGRKPANILRRFAQSFLMRYGVLRFLKRLNGTLILRFPNGDEKTFGKPTEVKHLINIRDMRFFTRTAFFGEIGLGESFMLGEWDTPNLKDLLGFFLDNLDSLEGKKPLFRRFASHFNNFVHHARQNTLDKSENHIKAHYDLSNEMFATFLDETMTYSSAFFKNAQETLSEGSLNKIRQIIEKAKIGPNHHVLEIGCGWGGFAIEAVRQTGCKVTGITLSQAQHDFATQRVQELGYADKIEIKLCDYRSLRGQYDRIVSIEMLEAVGHDFLPTYFKCCNQLLKTDGLMVLQTITIPDQQYHSYRSEADWIQKHIFPGGHLPSLTEIASVLTKYTQLLIHDAENIGVHYARTLAMWRTRFLSHQAQILQLGFTEEFIKKWIFYFSYCEVGFEKSILGNFQFILTRPGNPNLKLELES